MLCFQGQSHQQTLTKVMTKHEERKGKHQTSSTLPPSTWFGSPVRHSRSHYPPIETDEQSLFYPPLLSLCEQRPAQDRFRRQREEVVLAAQGITRLASMHPAAAGMNNRNTSSWQSSTSSNDSCKVIS